MDYTDYLTSEHWRTFRRLVLERDDYRCVLCNSGERLQVHHRVYPQRYMEKLSDCYTLCDRCHRAYSKKGAGK